LRKAKLGRANSQNYQTKHQQTERTKKPANESRAKSHRAKATGQSQEPKAKSQKPKPRAKSQEQRARANNSLAALSFFLMLRIADTNAHA